MERPRKRHRPPRSLVPRCCLIGASAVNAERATFTVSDSFMSLILSTRAAVIVSTLLAGALAHAGPRLALHPLVDLSDEHGLDPSAANQVEFRSMAKAAGIESFHPGAVTPFLKAHPKGCEGEGEALDTCLGSLAKASHAPAALLVRVYPYAGHQVVLSWTVVDDSGLELASRRLQIEKQGSTKRGRGRGARSGLVAGQSVQRRRRQLPFLAGARPNRSPARPTGGPTRCEQPEGSHGQPRARRRGGPFRGRSRVVRRGSLERLSFERRGDRHRSSAGWDMGLRGPALDEGPRAPSVGRTRTGGGGGLPGARGGSGREEAHQLGACGPEWIGRRDARSAV